MKNWIRIILVFSVLVGSTAFFGYWSFNQFNVAFDNLSALYLAKIPPVSLSKKTDREQISTTTPEITSDLATSTDSVNLSLSTTTPEITSDLATSTDVKLSFTFPKKNSEIYIGCTYQISWQSSTTTNSLTTTLIEIGSKESTGSKVSGLAKENTIKKDSQNLNWKVGSVVPGAYYIKISKINGISTEIKSNIFIINKTPENINASEQKNICKESGGLM